MGAYLRTAAETYQKKHGLLTANEMRHRRLALGFKTQQALSDAAPNIAIATLKRLEAGCRIQDTATDVLLRCELCALEEKQKREQMRKFFQENPWHAFRETKNANAEPYSAPAWNTATTPEREEAFAQ